MYSQYINNIDKQERLYNHLYKANSNFRVLCDSVRALPESKHLDLPAYLAKVLHAPLNSSTRGSPIYALLSFSCFERVVGTPRTHRRPVLAFFAFADGRVRAQPMQRICKYPLLFRELVRFTLPTSPERKQLEEVTTPPPSAPALSTLQIHACAAAAAALLVALVVTVGAYVCVRRCALRWQRWRSTSTR